MPHPLIPPRGHQAACPAYVMPFALAASGVLLLLSLTLQALALQERLQVTTWERLRREEDLLASAAHRLLADLNGSHPCLLVLPLARWEVEGSACASPQARAALLRIEVWSVPVRLLSWEPDSEGVTAELEIEPGQEHSARRGRFQARLDGVPPQAVDLRARDLAGALP